MPNGCIMALAAATGVAAAAATGVAGTIMARVTIMALDAATGVVAAAATGVVVIIGGEWQHTSEVPFHSHLGSAFGSRIA